jgi:FkbM family methyltransferase
MFPYNMLRLWGHLSWIRFGIRDRVIRALHNPDTCSSKNFVINFFGKKYKGDFATFIDWSTYYYGAYCKEELMFMRDVLSGISNPIVLDVGANIGHHTLFAALYAKEVHAFEPFPEVAKKLYEKLFTNKIDNVVVHEVGLGQANEDLPYAIPVGANTGSGSFMELTKEDTARLILPIRIGDDLIRELQLAQLDFIKMDVEGFEPQALQGLKASIKKFRPIIFFEWSANERKIQAEPKDFFPEGYSIFTFIENRPFLGLFNKKGYILIEENGSLHSDGNKVALPNEKINTLLNKKKA